MSEIDTPPAADGANGGLADQRIDRRRAMQVALGAATAAAVWSAPRVEGFSLAPDYAAAASCTGGSGAQTTKNSNNCAAGTTECWGNNCCGNFAYGAVNIPGGFTLNGVIGGNVNGDNGSLNMVIAGIDPPFQQCTVNVAGNCNDGGTFRTSGGGTSQNFVFNANGNQSTLIDCQGGGSIFQPDPDGQVRVNVSCVCS